VIKKQKGKQKKKEKEKKKKKQHSPFSIIKFSRLIANFRCKLKGQGAID